MAEKITNLKQKIFADLRLRPYARTVCVQLTNLLIMHLNHVLMGKWYRERNQEQRRLLWSCNQQWSRIEVCIVNDVLRAGYTCQWDLALGSDASFGTLRITVTRVVNETSRNFTMSEEGLLRPSPHWKCLILLRHYAKQAFEPWE